MSDLGLAPARAASTSAHWTDALQAGAKQELDAGSKHLHARAMDAMERTLIETALRVADGHKQKAALALGLGRNTLTRKLAQWDDDETPRKSGGGT